MSLRRSNDYQFNEKLRKNLEERNRCQREISAASAVSRNYLSDIDSIINAISIPKGFGEDLVKDKIIFLKESIENIKKQKRELQIKISSNNYSDSYVPFYLVEEDLIKKREKLSEAENTKKEIERILNEAKDARKCSLEIIGVLEAKKAENLQKQNQCNKSIYAGIQYVQKLLLSIETLLDDFNVVEGIGNAEERENLNNIKTKLQSISSQKKELQKELSLIVTHKNSIATIPSESELKRKETILKQVAQLSDKTTNLTKSIQILKKASDETEEKILKALNTQISSFSGMSWDIENEEEKNKRKQQEEFAKKKSVVKTKLIELLENELSLDFKDEVEKLLLRVEKIQEPKELLELKTLKIDPLIERYKKHLRLIEKCGKRFDELNAMYIYLCNIRGEAYTNYELSEENCYILENKIADIEEKIYKEQEQEYIAELIDETMEEMGYKIKGNRIFQNNHKEKFFDELYEFNNNTVVQVRYSRNGQVTMELAGRDNTLRMPSSSETKEIIESSHVFCEKFDNEFERKLAGKGVLRVDYKHLPPAPAYAYIINEEDFEKDATTSETIRKKKRRQVLAEPKAKHMGE